MYDQEPMLPGIVNDISKWTDSAPPSQYQSIKNLNDPILITWFLRTTSFPIWCHSIWNSLDLEDLETYGFIGCYYWYHAFIARDWYRLYQFNRSLIVSDKSQAANRFLLYCRDITGTRAYRAHLLSILADRQNKIQANWSGSRAVHPDSSAIIDIQDALNCGIHLVAETLFDNDQLYLTEKVFKPMVMSQPFVIAGPAGTLDLLRRYGFKTFGHVWDESYDREQNASRRLAKICQLVKDLCDMPQDQYARMYASCLDVIAHNRRHFFSDKFLHYCWDELDQNFTAAKAKRYSLETEKPWGQLLEVVANRPELLGIDFIKNLVKNVLLLTDGATRSLFLHAHAHISDL